MKNDAQRMPHSAEADAAEVRQFEEAHRRIVTQRLFLDPDFSRDRFVRLVLLNKNRAARVLRRCAGTNFYGYLGRLRLAYAVELMTRCPDVPMKAIAADSGFRTVRAFYRTFRGRYGMTPGEYRKKL